MAQPPRPQLDEEPQPGPSSQDRGPAPWARDTRLAGLTLLLLGILGLALFAVPIRDIVMMGFLWAFLLYGPESWLMRIWPRRPLLRVAIVYGTTAVILAAALLWGVSWLFSQAETLTATLESTAATLSAEAVRAERGTLLAALQSLDAVNLINVVTGLDVPSGALAGVIGVVALLATGLFVAFFLEIHLSNDKMSLGPAIPEGAATEVTVLLRHLDGLWVGYLQAMVIYCVLLTLGSWLLFVILGVPQPVLMAVFNGLITLIPSIGGLVGSLVTGMVCLAFGSTRFTDMSPATFAAIVLILHIVLVQVTYNFIAMPIIGRFVRLPVWAVLLGVLAALAWGNILLAFLIPPLLGTVRLLGGYVLAKTQQRAPFETEVDTATPSRGFFSRLYRPDEGAAATD